MLEKINLIKIQRKNINKITKITKITNQLNIEKID